MDPNQKNGPRPPRKPRARKTAPATTLAGESAPIVEGEPLAEQLALDATPPGLPELSFPSTDDRELIEWVAEKRRRRIRIEMYGSAAIVAAGIGASFLTQTAAFLILCLVGVGAVLAYEFLVASME